MVERPRDFTYYCMTLFYESLHACPANACNEEEANTDSGNYQGEAEEKCYGYYIFCECAEKQSGRRNHANDSAEDIAGHVGSAVGFLLFAYHSAHAVGGLERFFV